MSDLLAVHNWNHLLRMPSGIPPRIMEVPVDPNGAPYLVSAREGFDHPLVWVHKANRQGKIRACPRKDLTVRSSVIQEIAVVGEEKDIGNVFELSEQGMKDAQAYLAKFGFEEIEALIAEDVKESYLPTDVNAFVKEWVPDGYVVLVPKDRSYFGDLGQMSSGHVVVVIHNPLRGIAIVK